MSKLSQWQQQFAEVMLSKLPPNELMPQLKEVTHLSDRLALYKGNLSAVWIGALKQAYPVLYQLVGSDFFDQMAREYGRVHPSQSGNLHFFGAQLSDFLSHSQIQHEYAYFSEVARLEWDFHRAYYEEDAEPLNLSTVLSKAAELGQDLQNVQLLLNPAARLFHSTYSVIDIWHAHQADEIVFPETIMKHNYGIISRPAWHVKLRSVDKADYLALDAIWNGALFGDALELAMNEHADFNIAQHVQTWFTEGLFVGAAFPSQ